MLGGYYYSDLIAAGPLSCTTHFVVANQLTGFSQAKYSGLLALNIQNPLYGYSNFVQDLKNQGIISSAVFALYFNDLGYFSSYDTYGNFSSVIQIGGYDLSSYTTTGLIYLSVPIVSPYTDWIIQFNTVSIGTFALNTNVLAGVSSINYIQATTSDFSSLLSALASLQYSCSLGTDLFYYCKCSSSASMPSLSLTYAGISLSITGQNLWKYVGGSCQLLIAKTTSTNWWLGASFLHEYYTIFDADQKNLKFSPAIQNNTQTTSYAKLLRAYALIWLLAFFL